MQNILVAGERLVLRTGMSKDEFSKANIIQYINDKGYVAEQNTDGEYVFREWCFDSVEESGSKIELSGDSFSGTTLYDILCEIQNSAGGDVCIKPNEIQKKYWNTVVALIQAVKSAAAQKVKIPNSGPLGIVCGADGSFLFLPDIILNRSLSIRSQELVAEYYYSWKQPLLPYEETFSLTCAAYLYTILTCRTAFPAKSIDDIAEDYCDCNFVPVQYYATIKPELAEKINNCLDGKKKFRPTVARLLDFLSLEIDSLYYIEENAQNPSDVLAKFLKKQTASVKRLRFFKKHIGAISAVSVIMVCLLAFAASTLSSIKSTPTTKGLTPFETVESYYAGYNHLYDDIVGACLAGRDTKAITNVVSQIYVTGKMQAYYGSGPGIFTPAQWLLMPDLEKAGVFGITRLLIDGKPADLSAEYIRNTGREALYVKAGEKALVNASFYLLSNLQEEGISVEKHEAVLTLAFLKKRWYITHIDETITPVKVDLGKFIKAWKNGSVEEYKWLPSEAELKVADAELQKKYSVLGDIE